MRRSATTSAVLALVAAAPRAAAQSAHLSALERSLPVPVVEPALGICAAGLAGVWSDPTSCPRTSGAFFAVFEASYSAVQVYHGGVALKWGPRWAMTYGSAQIHDLFDTSLTNQDPTLSGLRAQAIWTGLDATVQRGRFVINAGISFAGDDNVGDRQSSTIGRAHLRVSPFAHDWLSIGLHATGVIGGSIDGTPSGRQRLDVTLRRRLRGVAASATAAGWRGALWRYSEGRGGFGVAAGVEALGALSIAGSAGRYATSYGTTSTEWHKSVVASVLFRGVRVAFGYTDSKLGLGSGFGGSVGYESP